MARWGRMKRAGVVGATLATLLACDMGAVQPSLKPQARPAAAALPVPAVVQPTSPQSAALRRDLAQIEVAQLTQGMLRQDGGGVDTPFTADVLVRNFERIAFFNEYDGAFTGVGGATPLSRWEMPVRMEIIFGAGTLPSQRRSDARAIEAYAARLGRITGHPISIGGRPNFLVIIATEDDRAATLMKAAERVPGISAASLRAMNKLPDDTYCAVGINAAGPNESTPTAAIVMIRAENPDLLRLSCIHEELAQALGLPNDSPNARPSIFNDNDEFALLTTHDEMLLKMLYDDRLSPGMTAAEAMPIARIIARELTGEPL